VRQRREPLALAECQPCVPEQERGAVGIRRERVRRARSSPSGASAATTAA
jgi:hypothetical protein